MKIELINPSISRMENFTGGKNFKFECITLATLAAYIPPDVEVKITDEIVDRVDFMTDADVIGISSLTYNSPRAYFLADEFRKRGKTVLLGGVHVSICPEEALLHADAIVQGEGEEVMQEIIRDIKAGRLRQVYSSPPVNLSGTKSPRYDLLSGKYLPFRLVQTVRGCANNCSFCSINRLYGKRIRYRDIRTVVSDVYESPLKFMYITDDNFYQLRNHSLAIMSEIEGARKHWVGYASADAGDDDQWLDAAQRSGCKGLFIGFESLDKKCLAEVNKKNDFEKYGNQIRNIRARGITIVGGFIFGFDNESRSIFDTTLEFVLKNRIDMLICAALTPFPGTKLYDDLARQNRLDEPRWWLKGRNWCDMLFRPAGELGKEEIEEKINWLMKEFYRLRHFLDRFINMPAKLSVLDILTYIAAYITQKNFNIIKKRNRTK